MKLNLSNLSSLIKQGSQFVASGKTKVAKAIRLVGVAFVLVIYVALDTEVTSVISEVPLVQGGVPLEDILRME